jgi:TRAP-type C4-dicarboxylate transport system substrate-binding protein
MISTHLWDRLSKQQQTWLQAAADASATHQRKLWAQAEEEALNAVKAAGVNVIYPDKKPFAKAVEAMFEEYKSSPEVYNYIKRIKAMDDTQ